MFAPWMRNAAYLTALAAATPWLIARSLRTGRYRQGWREKLLGLTDLPQHVQGTSPKQTIWLHGVSVGEVQLLSPLMKELSSQRQDLSFAVSTTTTTGMELAHKLFDETVRKFYFPLDFSWAVARTMRTLQPAMLVLGELEVWPNLVSACQHQQVPVAIVNGRLSDRSFRSYQRFDGLVRSTFGKLDLICAQNAIYADRFRRCGVATEKVQTTGSVKFDNVETDRQAATVQRLRRLVGLEQQTARVFVLGSSQAAEELASLRAYLAIRERASELKLIIVPRHRERFDEAFQQLQRELQDSNTAPVKVLRRSELTSSVNSNQWDILLIDTIGELRWWWGLADMALVGGSFGSRGGQNMIEPAAYGASFAVGPHTENFRDTVEALLAADAAERLEGVEAIQPWIERQLASVQTAVARGRRAQQLVLSQQGALKRTASALLELLPQCSGHSAVKAA